MAAAELAGWILGAGYILLLMVFIFGMEARRCAKERERYYQETLRLEERLHQEQMRLRELASRLEKLSQEHGELKSILEELKKEKCKVVEVREYGAGR